MARADILAELDRFEGRVAPPSPVELRAPLPRRTFREERLRRPDRTICVRPRFPRGIAGMELEEPRTVLLVSEDQDRFVAHPLEHGPEEPPIEFPKFAWVKVSEGACPALVQRRRPFPPIAEAAMVLAEPRNGGGLLAYDEPIVGVMTTPTPTEELEEETPARAERLTAGDRVLVWLYSNRDKLREVGMLFSPREFSADGISEGAGVLRAPLSTVLGNLEDRGYIERVKRRVLPDSRGKIDTFTLTARGTDYVAGLVRQRIFPSTLPTVARRGVGTLTAARASATLARNQLRSSITSVRSLIGALERSPGRPAVAEARAIERDLVAEIARIEALTSRITVPSFFARESAGRSIARAGPTAALRQFEAVEEACGFATDEVERLGAVLEGSIGRGFTIEEVRDLENRLISAMNQAQQGLEEVRGKLERIAASSM
jgi:hypothetical protein